MKSVNMSAKSSLEQQRDVASQSVASADHLTAALQTGDEKAFDELPRYTQNSANYPVEKTSADVDFLESQGTSGPASSKPSWLPQSAVEIGGYLKSYIAIPTATRQEAVRQIDKILQETVRHIRRDSDVAITITHLDVVMSSASKHNISLSGVPERVISEQSVLWWAAEKKNIPAIRLLLLCHPSKKVVQRDLLTPHLTTHEGLKFLAILLPDLPDFARSSVINGLADPSLHPELEQLKMFKRLNSELRWFDLECLAQELDKPWVSEFSSIVSKSGFTANHLSIEYFIGDRFNSSQLFAQLRHKVGDEILSRYLQAFDIRPVKEFDLSFGHLRDAVTERMASKQKMIAHSAVDSILPALLRGFEQRRGPDGEEPSLDHDSLFLIIAKSFHARRLDMDSLFRFWPDSNYAMTLRDYAKRNNLTSSLHWLDTDGLT